MLACAPALILRLSVLSVVQSPGLSRVGVEVLRPVPPCWGSRRCVLDLLIGN